jgi:homocitrate synthase NifV
MIRICDRTLSCLDGTDADRSDLSRLLALLIETDVDGIELSEKMYRLLSPLPDYSGYVFRVWQASDVARYAAASRFICHNAEIGSDARIRSEVLLNDVREAYTIARYADCPKIRVQGLDDVLLGDYLMRFQNVRNSFHGDIEFCPGNRFHMATALASEWVTNNIGHSVVTALGGIGGFAPTEELIMILRVRRLRKVGKAYPFFPEIADLMKRITGTAVRRNKPIIGRRIFHVESGIHVDGIVKQPKCYEPFPPDVVGRTRKVILGKQSGAASVRVKLAELGIEGQEERIPQILERVKAVSAEKNGALTHKEFYDIVRGCRP